MAVTVREATRADLPALEIVRRQAIERGFTEYYNREAVADRVANPDDALSNCIDSRTHLVVVVESDVTLFAYGVYERATGRILGVYTAPAYERDGWGTRVLERIEDEARTTDSERIRVRAPKNARPFFETNGFRAIGETTRDGIAVLQMRKDL